MRISENGRPPQIFVKFRQRDAEEWTMDDREAQRIRPGDCVSAEYRQDRIVEKATSSVVVAATQGGLGNQLFQLAASYDLAHRHQATLIVDTTGATNRSSCVLTFGAERSRLTPLDRIQLKRIASRGGTTQQSGQTSYVFESDPLPYSPLPMNRRTILKGYFQDVRYWWDNREFIRAVALRELQATSGATPILSRPTIGVHVRRGDYLVGRAAEELGFVGIGYYKNGINHLRKQLPGADVIMFSDDPDFVRSTDFGVDVIDGSSHSDVDTILTLANCDGLVMSNSSMSWWGSFLSGNCGERIVCPTPWSPTFAWLDPPLAEWTKFERTERASPRTASSGLTPK